VGEAGELDRRHGQYLHQGAFFFFLRCEVEGEEVNVFIFRLLQVYTLEKVLKLKKDQNTQTTFLDEAMTVRFPFLPSYPPVLIPPASRFSTTNPAFSSGRLSPPPSNLKPRTLFAVRPLPSSLPQSLLPPSSYSP
jgi:hypothetical protein